MKVTVKSAYSANEFHVLATFSYEGEEYYVLPSIYGKNFWCCKKSECTPVEVWRDVTDRCIIDRLGRVVCCDESILDESVVSENPKFRFRAKFLKPTYQYLSGFHYLAVEMKEE